MAEPRCRSCGGTVPTGAATCPHCGIEAPVATGAAGGAMGAPRAPETHAPEGTGSRAATGPLPERGSAGSRVGRALKALGCLVLALVVLAIAVVVGVFDLFF